MKKELGVLLLIFIATVGLSAAASAQPVSAAPKVPTRYGHAGSGHYYFPHWTIYRRFVVYSAFTVNKIRYRYHSPWFRTSARYIGHHRFIVTVWRKVYWRR